MEYEYPYKNHAHNLFIVALNTKCSHISAIGTGPVGPASVQL